MSKAGDAIRALTQDNVQTIVGSPGRLPDHETDRIIRRFAQVAESVVDDEPDAAKWRALKHIADTAVTQPDLQDAIEAAERSVK